MIPKEYFAQPLLDLDDLIAGADWEARYELIRHEFETILATEGPYHCKGIYYANEDDAGRQQMWEAEKRIDERLRIGRMKQMMNDIHIPKELRSA
jgi:hypothetical protein